MNLNLLLLILGTILVIEGIPYFLFPAKIKKFYERLKIAENNVLRVAGFLMIVIGLIIVYMVKEKVCQ
jgi:uncharacterized protein YjeT (DUF2065 family)